VHLQRLPFVRSFDILLRRIPVDAQQLIKGTPRLVLLLLLLFLITVLVGRT
jgi:hypothetical protein